MVFLAEADGNSPQVSNLSHSDVTLCELHLRAVLLSLKSEKKSF